jgi:hypothetical protein
MLPKGAQKGHLGGIAAAGNQHPTAARDVVPCIKYVPAVFKKHLKPDGEIYGRFAQGTPASIELMMQMAQGRDSAAGIKTNVFLAKRSTTQYRLSFSKLRRPVDKYRFFMAESE